MKNLTKYGLVAMVLVLSTSTFAHAGDHHIPVPHPTPPPSWDPPSAPEVDPGMAMSGISLLAGALTIMRVSRRKQ